MLQQREPTDGQRDLANGLREPTHITLDLWLSNQEYLQERTMDFALATTSTGKPIPMHVMLAHNQQQQQPPEESQSNNNNNPKQMNHPVWTQIQMTRTQTKAKSSKSGLWLYLLQQCTPHAGPLGWS